jgi:hypothetical protein
MPCAVILTALPVEYLAVRKHIANPKEVVHPNGTVYERGDFVDDWRVGLVEIGAALEAERAINYFKSEVEMEGFSFLEAARSNQQVSTMVIRGISDLIDGKSKLHKTGYQNIVAIHTSIFIFEISDKFQFTEKIDCERTKQQNANC